MKPKKTMKQKAGSGRYSLGVRILALACAVLIVVSAFLFLFFAG